MAFAIILYQPASIKFIISNPGNAINAVAVNLLPILEFRHLKLHGDEFTMNAKSYAYFQNIIFPSSSFRIPALRNVAAPCSTGSGKKRETRRPAPYKNTFAVARILQNQNINRRRTAT
jgi:hypothetical protein